MMRGLRARLRPSEPASDDLRPFATLSGSSLLADDGTTNGAPVRKRSPRQQFYLDAASDLEALARQAGDRESAEIWRAMAGKYRRAARGSPVVDRVMLWAHVVLFVGMWTWWIWSRLLVEPEVSPLAWAASVVWSIYCGVVIALHYRRSRAREGCL